MMNLKYIQSLMSIKLKRICILTCHRDCIIETQLLYLIEIQLKIFAIQVRTMYKRKYKTIRLVNMPLSDAIYSQGVKLMVDNGSNCQGATEGNQASGSGVGRVQ